MHVRFYAAIHVCCEKFYSMNDERSYSSRVRDRTRVLCSVVNDDAAQFQVEKPVIIE